jgi:hypothetical protein
VTAAQLIDLRYTPRPWQRQCHETRARFRVLAVHRRAGKTRLALMELIDSALRSTLEAPLYAYVAPYRTQAQAIAWSELKRIVEPLRIAGALEVREGDLQVRMQHNGATIRLAGADNADALRGLRLDGVVLDEPAWIRPEAWSEVIQPALADRQGWALFIGTPNGIDLFSELFFKASSLPGWAALRYTCEETDALAREEIERLRREQPAQAFAREMLCDFTASADDQLMSLADVQLAAERQYADREFMYAPKVIGVDPARFGDDRSVIVRRQGLVMLAPIVLRDQDNMTLAARVAQEIDLWRADACFVDSGAGAGVIDRLRQLRYAVQEVPFGGRALKAEYVNRRTEMWFAVREWIRAGGQIPDDPALKQELATPIYWFDSAGRKVLESKEDIKKRLPGAGSPDIADALCLTFAAPVSARTEELRAQQALAGPRREYDPFRDL